MIEINSSVHQTPNTLQAEMLEIQHFLAEKAIKLNILFCGGGTHPFQRWATQKIFPTRRYKKLSRQYNYLSKRSTVFGQHIHIGCENGEDAIYLTHALSRYVPQLIAISASSPFYQGIDTSYHSSRASIFNAFPLSGVIPFFSNWQTFSAYFYKMRELGIIESMKDFYWDIRPKPEFGTVETRVFDMPLTSKKGVIFAAYLQALALYLLQEKPITISSEMYYLYNYNRFQASRYGFDGNIIDPTTFQHITIYDDIQDTIKKIERYANQLNNMMYITLLSRDVVNKINDTERIREIYAQLPSLQKLVCQQCNIWSLNQLNDE
jgi:glutamate---cysteine ligase / carboxylate-amine ligase